jgi:hypothetical protein
MKNSTVGLIVALVSSLAVASGCRHEVPKPPDPVEVSRSDAAGNIDPVKIDAAAHDTAVVPAVDTAVAAVDVPPAHDVVATSDVPEEAAAVDVAAADVPPVITPPAPDAGGTCGAPGQPCCAGNACHDNGCCAAGNNAVARCIASGAACRTADGESAGVCGNGACGGCGAALNQPCCQGNICTGAGLACNGERCGSCGGADQPCCPGRTCGGGGCCVRTGGDDVCVTQGETCPLQGPGSGGLCMAGTCSGCGGTNQPCCNGGICNQAGQACIAGRCGTCGGQNQPSCPANQCPTGGCINADGTCIGVGTECGQQSGTCNADGSCGHGEEACGGPSQPCCGLNRPPAGAFCTKPGTMCSMGGLGMGLGRRCIACGGIDQPCCDGDECREGNCRNSGGFGQRTCRN